MTSTEEQNLHQRIAELGARLTKLETEHGEALALLQTQLDHICDVLDNHKLNIRRIHAALR